MLLKYQDFGHWQGVLWLWSAVILVYPWCAGDLLLRSGVRSSEECKFEAIRIFLSPFSLRGRESESAIDYRHQVATTPRYCTTLLPFPGCSRANASRYPPKVFHHSCPTREVWACADISGSFASCQLTNITNHIRNPARLSVALLVCNLPSFSSTSIFSHHRRIHKSVMLCQGAAIC